MGNTPPLAGTHRYPAIDLARITAALAVLFYHYAFYFGIPDTGFGPRPFPALSPVARYGHLGVQLFFMISGFLIVQSAGAKSVGGFVKARVKRLYPAYLVCCTLTFFVYQLTEAPLQPVGGLTRRDFFYNLTMLNGVVDSLRGVAPSYIDGSYWTLAVEWLFYGLVALLIATRALKRLEVVLWGWALLSFASWLSANAFLRVVTLTPWAGFFIAGATFYAGHSNGWTKHRLALLTCAFGLALAQVLEQNEILRAGFGVPFHRSITVGIVITFFAFFASLPKLTMSQRGLSLSNLALLGALSYPIYLLHFHLGAIQFRAYWAWFPGYAVLALLLTTVVAMSYAIHRWIEKPVWRLARRKPEPRLGSDGADGRWA